jgi:hypothetical protein
MRYKRKLILLLSVFILVLLMQYVLPGNSAMVSFYDKYLFRPFQSFRNIVFESVPFSVGDLLYLAGIIMIVIVVCKWIYYLIRFREHKHDLSVSMLHSVIVLGILYIVFFLGWGGNYYKVSLSSHWNLDKSHWRNDSTLVTFDEYLIGKLNSYAPGYRPLSFKQIDKNAQNYYREYTDSRTKMHGIKVKPSVFGFFMQNLGIQGYYNPFTGEAQVNRFLPAFMLPFVICHEMAHQSGVAAEDDANLLSYVVSTVVEDSTFKYSAYFNLWLYTHARLRVFDSSKARLLAKGINNITKSHLDVLRDIRRRYDSELSDYSSVLYDGYLRLHHQKDGIESYNKVAITAWAWEQERAKKGSKMVISLP